MLTFKERIEIAEKSAREASRKKDPKKWKDVPQRELPLNTKLFAQSLKDLTEQFPYAEVQEEYDEALVEVSALIVKHKEPEFKKIVDDLLNLGANPFASDPALFNDLEFILGAANFLKKEAGYNRLSDRVTKDPQLAPHLLKMIPAFSLTEKPGWKELYVAAQKEEASSSPVTKHKRGSLDEDTRRRGKGSPGSKKPQKEPEM